MSETNKFLLKGALILVARQEHIIKAKESGEKDTRYYDLTFGNGETTFSVTAGEKLECEKLSMFTAYECSFDVTPITFNGKTFNKLKLVSYKLLNAKEGVK